MREAPASGSWKDQETALKQPESCERRLEAARASKPASQRGSESLGETRRVDLLCEWWQEEVD